MIVEIYDSRLGSKQPNHIRPKGTHGVNVLVVEPNFPIAVPFNAARLSAKEPITVLRILCHGNEEELELGKDEVNHETVHNFRLFDGAFHKDALIALFSCSTVLHLKPLYGSGSDPFASAAMSYVKRIADITGVPVMASPDIQHYSDHRWHFGKWEGRVYVITPAGAVVRAPALGSWFEDDMEKVGLSKGQIRLIKNERAWHGRAEDPFPESERIWRHSRF